MFAMNDFVWLFAILLAFVSNFSFSAEESVNVSLLPPNPRVKNDALGFVDYKVWSVSAENKEPFVWFFGNTPLGDCPSCKRGISLNFKPENSDKGKEKSGAEGSTSGVGFRLETSDPTSKTIEIRIKNGSKYKLDFSKVRDADPVFLTADKPVLFFLTKQGLKVYRIKFSFKPRTAPCQNILGTCG